VNGLLNNSMLQGAVIDEFDLKVAFARNYEKQFEAKTLNAEILADAAFSPRRVARLEACALIAQSHRIEYRWPLYDRPLIRQFLQTPAIEKRHKTMGRYLHRRAVAGTIPDMITWKVSKDLGTFTTKLDDREVPSRVNPDERPPILKSLLDPDKLRKAEAEFTTAKSQNDLNETSIQQIKSLWRASLLDQWLTGSSG